MWGVSESREPIKGKFAKKLLAAVQKMVELKKEGKELSFKNKEIESCHHVVIRDDKD